MTPPGDSSQNNPRNDALFLTPEEPCAGTGGGGLRSASLLEYLKMKYDVTVESFTLPHHSKTFAARAWRNGWRFARGVPPLIDRFAGCEAQLAAALNGRRYRVAVIEHFWCAPYATAIRPHCDILVLDLHNIESELAATHARAAGGVQSILHRRFADAYRELEREWIPQFDVVLATSEEDRGRIEHRENIVVYPNALPVIELPPVEEENCIVFSGNLEYHPNIEAVRWFASSIWPQIRERNAGLTWDLIGRNPEAIADLVKDDPSIRVIGPVTDAVAAIATARVVVVPLLSGSGTRFKILEAWAAGRAVVSTKIGAEGLGARDGEHLLIADDPAGCADAVQGLLDDRARARTLGEVGRALYLDRYTWPAAWKKLTNCF
jgi:glycosyltransferase involved in cell wall biosynthesis